MDFHLGEPAWAALERQRGEKPFTVRVGGRVLRFRAAADLDAGLLVRAASDWRMFLAFCVSNTSELPKADFTWWKAEHMLRLYRAHHGLCKTPEQDARLFKMLDKDDYRDAAESDLHRIYRKDLGELWRARQWRTLLNMLDRLPRDSQYSEVAAGDMELAELILEAERASKGDRPGPARRVSEFTPEVELLSVVADRLAEILQVQVARKGGGRLSLKPMPRPKTAIAQLRERSEHKHVEFTLDRVFGRVDASGKPTGKGA